MPRSRHLTVRADEIGSEPVEKGTIDSIPERGCLLAVGRLPDENMLRETLLDLAVALAVYCVFLLLLILLPDPARFAKMLVRCHCRGLGQLILDLRPLLVCKDKVALGLLDDACKRQYIDKMLGGNLTELIAEVAEHVLDLSPALEGFIVSNNYCHTPVNDKDVPP